MLRRAAWAWRRPQPARFGGYLYWFLMCGRLLGGLLGGKISSKGRAFVASLALIFVLVGIFAPTDVKGAMPVFTGTGFGMVEVPVGVIFFTLCVR